MSRLERTVPILKQKRKQRLNCVCQSYNNMFKSLIVKLPTYYKDSQLFYIQKMSK